MQLGFGINKNRIEHALALVYETLNAPLTLLSGQDSSFNPALYQRGIVDTLRCVAIALQVRPPDARFESECLDAAPSRRVEPREHLHDPASIRRFLKDAFTDKDLRRFCQEHLYLRPVLDRCASNAGLDDMVDAVIEHCERRAETSQLLQDVRVVNPGQYVRHFGWPV